MTEEEKRATYGIGQAMQSDDEQGNGVAMLTAIELNATWQQIAERMQVDIETFGKQRGDMPGGLIQNLKEVNREKYDYTSFLKKFAVMGEAMKINDDEFDYIFYTYGLKLYDKMPLIEPLEYKEVKRIKEFVIAIDTSGSVVGEQVQAFVQKTYNILKSTESFFSKINLHIIQCDADIQEHIKITNQDEFDEYLKHMQIKGLGGTDFRPVFEKVDELIKNKEFRNLKGLIYFTDGYGIFPERKPDYDTAFVFVKDDYEIPDVPPWAIRLVLEQNDI
jgi:predicted metal-dependent peptidase